MARKKRTKTSKAKSKPSKTKKTVLAVASRKNKYVGIEFAHNGDISELLQVAKLNLDPATSQLISQHYSSATIPIRSINNVINKIACKRCLAHAKLAAQVLLRSGQVLYLDGLKGSTLSVEVDKHNIVVRPECKPRDLHDWLTHHQQEIENESKNKFSPLAYLSVEEIDRAHAQMFMDKDDLQWQDSDFILSALKGLSECLQNARGQIDRTDAKLFTVGIAPKRFDIDIKNHRAFAKYVSKNGPRVLYDILSVEHTIQHICETAHTSLCALRRFATLSRSFSDASLPDTTKDEVELDIYKMIQKYFDLVFKLESIFFRRERMRTICEMEYATYAPDGFDWEHSIHFEHPADMRRQDAAVVSSSSSSRLKKRPRETHEIHEIHQIRNRSDSDSSYGSEDENELYGFGMDHETRLGLRVLRFDMLRSSHDVIFNSIITPFVHECCSILASHAKQRKFGEMCTVFQQFMLACYSHPETRDMLAQWRTANAIYQEAARTISTAGMGVLWQFDHEPDDDGERGSDRNDSSRFAVEPLNVSKKLSQHERNKAQIEDRFRSSIRELITQFVPGWAPAGEEELVDLIKNEFDRAEREGRFDEAFSSENFARMLCEYRSQISRQSSSTHDRKGASSSNDAKRIDAEITIEDNDSKSNNSVVNPLQLVQRLDHKLTVEWFEELSNNFHKISEFAQKMVPILRQKQFNAFVHQSYNYLLEGFENTQARLEEFASRRDGDLRMIDNEPQNVAVIPGNLSKVADEKAKRQFIDSTCDLSRLGIYDTHTKQLFFLLRAFHDDCIDYILRVGMMLVTEPYRQVWLCGQSPPKPIDFKPDSVSTLIRKQISNFIKEDTISKKEDTAANDLAADIFARDENSPKKLLELHPKSSIQVGAERVGATIIMQLWNHILTHSVGDAIQESSSSTSTATSSGQQAQASSSNSSARSVPREVGLEDHHKNFENLPATSPSKASCSDDDNVSSESRNPRSNSTDSRTSAASELSTRDADIIPSCTETNVSTIENEMDNHATEADTQEQNATAKPKCDALKLPSVCDERTKGTTNVVTANTLSKSNPHIHSSQQQLRGNLRETNDTNDTNDRKQKSFSEVVQLASSKPARIADAPVVETVNSHNVTHASKSSATGTTSGWKPPISSSSCVPASTSGNVNTSGVDVCVVNTSTSASSYVRDIVTVSSTSSHVSSSDSITSSTQVSSTAISSTSQSTISDPATSNIAIVSSKQVATEQSYNTENSHHMTLNTSTDSNKNLDTPTPEVTSSFDRASSNHSLTEDEAEGVAIPDMISSSTQLSKSPDTGATCIDEPSVLKNPLTQPPTISQENVLNNSQLKNALAQMQNSAHDMKQDLSNFTAPLSHFSAITRGINDWQHLQSDMQDFSFPSDARKLVHASKDSIKTADMTSETAHTVQPIKTSIRQISHADDSNPGLKAWDAKRPLPSDIPSISSLATFPPNTAAAAQLQDAALDTMNNFESTIPHSLSSLSLLGPNESMYSFFDRGARRNNHFSEGGTAVREDSQVERYDGTEDYLTDNINSRYHEAESSDRLSYQSDRDANFRDANMRQSSRLHASTNETTLSMMYKDEPIPPSDHINQLDSDSVKLSSLINRFRFRSSYNSNNSTNFDRLPITVQLAVEYVRSNISSIRTLYTTLLHSFRRIRTQWPDESESANWETELTFLFPCFPVIKALLDMANGKFNQEDLHIVCNCLNQMTDSSTCTRTGKDKSQMDSEADHYSNNVNSNKALLVLDFIDSCIASTQLHLHLSRMLEASSRFPVDDTLFPEANFFSKIQSPQLDYPLELTADITSTDNFQTFQSDLQKISEAMSNVVCDSYNNLPRNISQNLVAYAFSSTHGKILAFVMKSMCMNTPSFMNLRAATCKILNKYHKMGFAVCATNRRLHMVSLIEMISASNERASLVSQSNRITPGTEVRISRHVHDLSYGWGSMHPPTDDSTDYIGIVTAVAKNNVCIVDFPDHPDFVVHYDELEIVGSTHFPTCHTLQPEDQSLWIAVCNSTKCSNCVGIQEFDMIAYTEHDDTLYSTIWKEILTSGPDNELSLDVIALKSICSLEGSKLTRNSFAKLKTVVITLERVSEDSNVESMSMTLRRNNVGKWDCTDKLPTANTIGDAWEAIVEVAALKNRKLIPTLLEFAVYNV